jgi:hypothetical protein
VVEAQHLASTMKLTDTIEEQSALEDLIDETKPPIPQGCEHLDRLLVTPFRYSVDNPNGSRFRRPNAAEGVFYCAKHVDTAVAEAAFYRILFYAESPATPWPTNAAEFTAFSVKFSSSRAIDISTGPLALPAIYHPSNHSASQRFADEVRAAGLDIIKYASVRDPERRENFALLSCGVFKSSKPLQLQSWWLHLDKNGARARCESPRATLAFGREAFAADMRMRGFAWDR